MSKTEQGSVMSFETTAFIDGVKVDEEDADFGGTVIFVGDEERDEMELEVPHISVDLSRLRWAGQNIGRKVLIKVIVEAFEDEDDEDESEKPS